MKKIIGLFLFFVVSGWAQTPYSINFSTEEGLPSSNIYYVFQDSDNYIWFATDVGVVKYNGREFLHYNTDDGLPDNEVFQIHQDNKGRIWFQTLNGKLGFYWNHQFYNEKNTPWLKNKILSSMLVDFYNDSKGNVLITDRLSGVFALDSKNKPLEIDRFSYKTPDRFTHVLRMMPAKNSTELLTIKGIYTLDGRLVLPFPPGLTDTMNTRSCILGQTVYFNSGNTIYSYTAGKLEKLFTLPIAEPMIISVNAESREHLRIGTRDGLYDISKKGNGYVFRKFLDKLSVSHSIKDKDGNYWITTLESGVFMIPSLDVSVIDNLANNKITVLAKDGDNSLWAGSSDSYYYHFERNKARTFQTYDPAKNMIKDIQVLPDEVILVGNKQVAINQNGIQHKIPVGHNSLHIDRQGHYWIGGTVIAKLTKEQYNSLTFPRYSTIYNKTLKLQKRTNKIVGGNLDDLWIGTNFGLYKYSPKDSMQDYSAKLKNINSNVEDLYYDSGKNRLVVATNSMGIVILENEKIVAHLGKRDNLSNNTCKSIFPAGKNSYWIGTNTGLDRVSLRNKKFIAQNFNAYLGLENNKINDVLLIKDTLYLATDKGIIYFNQFKTTRRKTKPVIHLTDFKVNSKSTSFEKNIVLESGQNELTIAYDGIGFLENEKIKYYYLLEGTDDKWYVTTSNQINYKALAPGDYTFKVYMKDSLNNPSNTAKIRFCINQPFWKTVPFVLCFLLLSMAVLFYIWRMRLKKLERKFNYERKVIQAERDKANLEKQMIELEQKALRLQMNPHFIFNALNTIKGYYAEGNDVKASDYISKFSKLLRMLLETTEQLIPLAKEIEMLELYIALTQIRYRNKFDFDIIVDLKLNPDDTAIPAMLLQPMVENAIIHGLAPKTDKGMLHIGFEKSDELLICIVEDNGIGRSAAAQTHKTYISKATDITTERIALLENEAVHPGIEIIDKQDENHHATGTKVIISIPLTTIW